LIEDLVRFHGIKKEILNYVQTHLDHQNTLTQMAKEGGVRSTSASKNWLKKHLEELEQKEFIYSTKVRDPIRKVEYTYYTVIPKCSEKGEVGVSQWFIDHEAAYREIIVGFYSALEYLYSFLVADYCSLCEYIRNTGDETYACGDFD
jgi:hypothetical protein